MLLKLDKRQAVIRGRTASQIRLQRGHQRNEQPPAPSPPTITMASQTEEHSYHAQDAVSAALKATSLTGGVGLFAAAVQNTLTKQNVGPMGVFIKSGGTIGIFGMYTALNNAVRGLG